MTSHARDLANESEIKALSHKELARLLLEATNSGELSPDEIRVMREAARRLELIGDENLQINGA